VVPDVSPWIDREIARSFAMGEQQVRAGDHERNSKSMDNAVPVCYHSNMISVMRIPSEKRS
jgi:hypothetical protein